ncbi:MAG: polysaccharide biosynthesis tyrosine autokinase [Candidatus Omnitrophica bacterium]|nr:polysaccharide biosynthesis tyrosine autokinase [Candidatus Omnitrophota bacterium]
MDKNIHIKDYISILRNRKWIIISFFLITVTAVTIATFLQKKVYRATATVIVEVESPDVLSVKDVVKLGETNYFAYRDYLETQQEIIRSRRTAQNVIKNLNLAGLPSFAESEDPIETILKKLQVELVRDTRILKIHIDDNDPELASLIANEFARIYVDSNLALKIEMSSEAQAWLKDEVEKQSEKVELSEFKLQAYKEDNDIVSIENQQKIINESLIMANTNFLDAQRRKIRSESAYSGLVDKEGGFILESLPVILTENKTLQLMKDDYLKQHSLLVEYKEVYKHKHPKMTRLLENINYLEAGIKKEVENEYNVAIKEEDKFRAVLDNHKKEALEFERKIINYNTLNREVETNERILDMVLNRLKETSISTQMLSNNVRIQDVAGVPKKSLKPKKKLNIALSVIMGLVGGIGIAFFREYMDITLKDPEEIGVLLDTPILGAIPSIRSNGKKTNDRFYVDRIVEKDSNFLVSEAYRTIRTNLLFSLGNNHSAKSIVVTSSVPREGKTFIATNLAIMIANSGEKVLLVDADMRKSRVHTIFNDGNETGLSQFLLGESDFGTIVKPSEINNLYIVTSGKTTHKSAELISSNNMALFLEKASSQFSKIIFDTPPISIVTDAQLLSNTCTGVLLVVGESRVTKALLNNSKELLKKVDAKTIGVVVNNVSLTKSSCTYPQHYYSTYYKPA